MSEPNLTITNSDYMANKLLEKDDFIELLDILKNQGSLGPIPHIRAIRTLEKLYKETIN